MSGNQIMIYSWPDPSTVSDLWPVGSNLYAGGGIAMAMVSGSDQMFIPTQAAQAFPSPAFGPNPSGAASGVYGPSNPSPPPLPPPYTQYAWPGFGQQSFSVAHADQINMAIYCINLNATDNAYFNAWMTATDNLGNRQTQQVLEYEVPWEEQVGLITFIINVTGPQMTITLIGQPLGAVEIQGSDGGQIAGQPFDATATFCQPISFTYELAVQYPPIILNEVNVDLTLDYIPITILYCPPDQDMLNSLDQNTSYGTVVTMGNGLGASTFYQTTIALSGGVQISAGPIPGLPVAIGGSVSGSLGSQTQTSYTSSQNNGTNSTFTFSYSWDTLLTADNQTAIGRSYWGPLGDLFLLLKNPTWNVRQSTDGTFVLNPSPDYEAEVVIVPGHKLLNPSGDPVASAIYWQTRQKLLQLDPFYTNLDPFFPPDGSAPPADLDLHDAVDPYIDPSAGSNWTNLGAGSTTAGMNRACLISNYDIDNGVELDLTTQHSILFTNIGTNQSTYNADVTVMNSEAGAINLPFLDGNGSQQSVNGQSMQISYQTSYETSQGAIQTAHCKLVRSQVEQDLDGIQVWYDKLFSTFMFRLINMGQYCWFGYVYTDLRPSYFLRPPTRAVNVNGAFQYPLSNVMITLKRGDANYSTMTDVNGRFLFCNLPQAGNYSLLVGDKAEEVNIPEKARLPHIITGVTRTIDVVSAALWELQTLGLSLSKAAALKRDLWGIDTHDPDTIAPILREYGLSLRGRLLLDAKENTLAQAVLRPPGARGNFEPTDRPESDS